MEHYVPDVAAIREGRVPDLRLQDTHSAVSSTDHILPLAIGFLSRVVGNTGIEETHRRRLVQRGATFAVLEMMLHGWPRAAIIRALQRRIALYAATDSSAALALMDILRDLRGGTLTPPTR